jgi:hypothetical protein
MARTKDLQRLVQELSQLDASERSSVMADVARRAHPDPRSTAFSIPLVKGGTEWIGGDLRREELYDDDGR